MSDKITLIARFVNAGQEQVFKYFDQLDTAAQSQLLEQASLIDLSELERLVSSLVVNTDAHGIDLSDLEPAPYIALPEHGGNASEWAKARAAGEDALRAGRVAAFTVAGGQGTRLGYNGPKGTFPVTPVREATLFQVFAEKILSARRAYNAAIPWFIMTSTLNHEATKRFFADHAYFGLEEGSVIFFKQGLMPAVDFEGKILLESQDTIAMSPDGHGGSLRALVRSGATKHMAEMGIDTVSYFQVDNPLVDAIDAAFIGFHLQAGSEMSSKMLPKAYPKEKVGNFCKQRGNTVVIEYSDLPDELAEQRTPGGELAFVAGSIAIHVLDRRFIERMGGDSEEGLPFHRADKKIKALDPEGIPVKPDTPNGVKFEMFVFDALPFAKNPVIVECLRESSFAPVKNAEGVDSPQSCKELQLGMFAKWLVAAGADIELDSQGLPHFNIEVSPLFATSEEAFIGKWQNLDKKPDIREGLVLE